MKAENKEQQATVYTVGQIKRRQRGFFILLKNILDNFDEFWHVK